MLLQILLQVAMVADEIFVLHQRRISTQLLSDFWVAVHEAIKACQLPTSRIVVTPTLWPIEVAPVLVTAILRPIEATPILAPVKALFLAHETFRAFSYFLADLRMLLLVLL